MHKIFAFRHLSKKIIYCCCLLGLAAMPAASALSNSGGLSELVQAALVDNPELAAQRASLAAAHEGDDIARAALLPQIAVGGLHTIKQDNNPQNNDRTRLYASVNYQLFNLPLWEQVSAEKHRVTAAENRYVNAAQNLQLSVMEAWLDFQFSRGVAVLTQTRIDIAKEQLERAQTFADAGIRTTVDVLDARARLSALRADLLQQEYNVRIMQERIVNLAGLRGTPAELDESALRDFMYIPPLGAWLARVSKESLESAAVRAELESARAQVRASDKVIFPRLLLSAETTTPGALNQHSENVAMSFEQPLFTGGRIRAEARRVAATSIAAQQALHAVMRREELRVRELHGRILLAPSRWRALEAAAEAAAAALSAITAGYQGGVRIAADVLDAEESLFDTKLQLRRARYDYLKDLAALHVLAGATDKAFVRRMDNLFIIDSPS